MWSFIELCADAGVIGEIRSEGYAGQLALEVGGVAGAVLGVVEQGVGVVEDVALGDGFLAVVAPEFGEGPVGDVFAAVGAVFVVGMEREALRLVEQVEVMGFA